MCGRYTLTVDANGLLEHFGLFNNRMVPLQPRYNIAPTQPIAVVREVVKQGRAERELAHVVWGLIPSWAKDVSIGSKMINARSETVREKPAFRHAFRRRRCLVPADGFYEWKALGRKKQPYWIHHPDRKILAMAGIWEMWQNADGSELESCAILTTTANEKMRELHERMPVILRPEDYARWLGTLEQDAEKLVDLLRPCPESWLDMWPVSAEVSRAGWESPRNIEPVPIPPAPPPTSDSQGLLFGA